MGLQRVVVGEGGGVLPLGCGGGGGRGECSGSQREAQDCVHSLCSELTYLNKIIKQNHTLSRPLLE